MDNLPHYDSTQPDFQQPTLTEAQVSALYKSTPLSIGVTVMLDLILSISHWNVIGHGDLILWNILMMCALSLRIANWFFWRNTRQTFKPHYWLTSFRLGTMIAGAFWGSSAYFLFASFNPTYQALLAFTLAGVASGSLTTLAIDKISAVAFVTLAILPLSIRIHLEHGPIAMPMSVMTIMFIFFVLSATTRAAKQLRNNFESNARLIEWGNERIRQQKLGKIISDAQSRFIDASDDVEQFSQLLADINQFTESNMGFIGEVLYNEEQIPRLQMLAITNIAWDKNSRARYARIKTGGMEFSSLNSLYGSALITGRPIISNSPSSDMRAAGTPVGHVPLTSFVGIPIYNGIHQVAMLGLANRAGGYSEAQVETLKPILQLIGQFIIALRHHRQHRDDEEKLKQQAKHTQTILDEAFDAIITIDERGNITSFNHSAEIMFGYRSEQIVGQSVGKLMPETYRLQHDDYLQQYKISGIKHIIGAGRELTGVRRSGQEFPIEISVSEMVEKGISTYIGVVRDISERKHTEKLKNEFIATVSHELRTPLTSIAASLAIIESGASGVLPDKAVSLIQIAKQNSLRLQNLISDLLDMDRLLANQIEFNLENYDAVATLERAMDANKYFADKYHVNFQVTHVENGALYYGDVARTIQVLGHLLSNAAKFSPPTSTVELSVTCRGHWIRFAVTDHGPGIPNEFKSRIFNTFSQADSSSSRQKDGSGLGLTISKELIEKMGGNIGFTSSPGQGSCFYFELPATKHNSGTQAHIP